MPDISSLTVQGTTYLLKDSTARTSASAAQSAAEEAQTTASSAQQTASTANTNATNAIEKIDNLQLTGSLAGEVLTLGIEVGS